jgi:hypothetical protein
VSGLVTMGVLLGGRIGESCRRTGDGQRNRA